MELLKVYLRSLKLLWSERLLTAALVVSAVLVAVIQVFEPVLFGRVINSLSKHEQTFYLLTLWASMGLFNIFASVFMAVMSDRLAHRQRLSVIGQVFERAIGLPMSYHAERGSGRVVRAILTGADQLFSLWLAFMREHLSSFVSLAFLIPVALSMNAQMAGILFVLAAIYLVANSQILKRTHARQATVEGHHQDLFGHVGDVIGNVTIVQSYTRLTDEAKALQEIMTRLLRAQYPVLTWWGLLNVITRVSSTLTMVTILGYGSWLASKGEITVGEIVAFAGFSGLLIGKLDQVSSFFSRIVSQGPALQNFFELLDEDDKVMESPHAKPLEAIRGEVVFDNVTYHYRSRGQGVDALNFKVEAGSTVALVGPSGSGKTTTLALLQRMFDPQQGSIKIDGQDIRECTLASLRGSVATVFQDSGLFNRSIEENIRVGRPSAAPQEIIDAAQQAEAHAFITAKPDGYAFVIGERGSMLSGGERQRIAIARALLKHSAILIFDEATSALDNETEKKIQQALVRLRAGKTTFVIAHRLSTVVAADKILVFEHGRIVESGSFAELSQKGGVFARLLQAGGLLPEKTNKTGEVPSGD